MSKTDLGRNLLLIFSGLIVLIIGSLSTAIFSLSKISKITEDIYEHPFAVRQNVYFAEKMMYEIPTIFSGIIFSNNRSEEEIKKSIDLIREKDVELDVALLTASKKILGDKNLFVDANREIKNWKELRDGLISGKISRTNENMDLLIKRRYTIFQSLDKIERFAGNKAKTFYEESKKEVEYYKIILGITLLITILLCLVIQYLLVKTNRKIKDETSTRLNAEENFIEMENIFMSAVGNAPVPIMIRAEDGEVVKISDAWTEITGYTLFDIPTTLDWAEKAYGIKKQDAQNMFIIPEKKLHYGERQVRTKEGEVVLWDFYSASIGTLKDGRRIAMSIAIDVTDRKKAEENLAKINFRYELASEIGKVGFWEWNVKTQKIFWNNEMFKMYGLENNNNGMGNYEMWKSSVHPDDLENAEKLLSDTINNKKNSINNFRIIKPDNSIRYIVAYQDILLNEKNEVEKIVGTNIDETDRIEMERNLKDSKEQAEKANKAKSEFLSNMSHEIRTPMNGIIGFSEVLKELETDEEKIEIIDIIHDSSMHLLDLINDVLSLAKIEAGKVEVVKKSIDLGNLIKNIGMLFQQQAKNKKLNFIMDYDMSLKGCFFADEGLLFQVLNNLIGNSIKFTEKGEVRLIVKNLGSNEYNKKMVKFSVMDTGIGINAEKQKKLFEPFEQGDHYLTKLYGGTGLGLAIVKKLIDLMDGEIEVETELGKGTTISFKLFLECRKKELEKDREEKIEISSNLNIIAAEDDENNGALLKKIAKKENWNFKLVKDGEALIQEIAQGKYDLVLMDVKMPLINGIEATKIIRQNRRYDKLKIIGLSAFSLQEEIKSALDAGMNAYITKPYTLEKLRKGMADVFKEKI